MTALPLRQEPAKPSELDRLYAAWRYAKAQWDVADYALNGERLTNEETSEHAKRTFDALNAFLLHPADDAKQLARKMRVFRDEEIIDNWTRGPEIVEQLVRDAEKAAGWGDEA
jgi:hypothetical protein